MLVTLELGVDRNNIIRSAHLYSVSGVIDQCPIGVGGLVAERDQLMPQYIAPQISLKPDH